MYLHQIYGSDPTVLHPSSSTSFQMSSQATAGVVKKQLNLLGWSAHRDQACAGSPTLPCRPFLGVNPNSMDQESGVSECSEAEHEPKAHPLRQGHHLHPKSMTAWPWGAQLWGSGGGAQCSGLRDSHHCGNIRHVGGHVEETSQQYCHFTVSQTSSGHT